MPYVPSCDTSSLRQAICTNDYINRLCSASTSGKAKYLKEYRGRFPDVKAVEYATLHAVLEESFKIHSEGRASRNCSTLSELWTAFNTVSQRKYSYTGFSNLMNGKKDAAGLVIDRRGGNHCKINAVVKKWLLDIMSSGKAYGMPYMHRVICELCDEYGYDKPSLSWVKTNYYRLLPCVYQSRYGADANNYGQMPYAGIMEAQKRNTQWQIDGWRMPFYMDGWRTYTLFAVFDACSRKIVGYWVDFSENTDTILKGLENAVQNTGVLPTEILSDNHSFNKTREADNFKDLIASKGCVWTVSSNPRHKGIIERGFGVFGDVFCKDKRGYVGEGVRTKRKDGRTSQELLDRYTKAGMFWDENELKVLAAQLVEEYNTTGINGRISPSEKYDQSEENAVGLTFEDKIQLFIRRGEFTVRRGQININRGGVTYEYQLNKDNYLKINNKKVGVRLSTYDIIYIYDLESDDFICSVPRKQYAHGAIAEQTPEDIEILNRNKGRLNGIKTAFEQRQEAIARAAEGVDPEAAYAMNAKLTPKDVLESFKTDGKLRKEAERLGVDTRYIPDRKWTSEVSTIKRRKSRVQAEKERKPLLQEIETVEITEMTN